MQSIVDFQHKILKWYDEHKRPLPRRQTVDPYRIRLSEIMLQQTQVSRVLVYYENFLKELPSIKEFAVVENAKLLGMWSGLGYNSRVLRMKKTAQFLVEHSNGLFPDTYKGLLTLPGIGDYTASAILAFSHNMDVAVIDVNVKRVFIHELGLSEKITNDELRDIVLQALPKGNARNWYNALMDYGSIVLPARKTGIRISPKQSLFKGSTRELRSKIVKILLLQGSVEIGDMKKTLDDERFDSVLKKMIVEGVVKNSNGYITL